MARSRRAVPASIRGAGPAGRVDDITALEDIVTPDGTVHLKAGELAATLTTGSDGTATSEPLYLGRLSDFGANRAGWHGNRPGTQGSHLVLRRAGSGNYLRQRGFVNERQKVEISLQKLLEQDENLLHRHERGNGKNITFGLFAAEGTDCRRWNLHPADGADRNDWRR